MDNEAKTRILEILLMISGFSILFTASIGNAWIISSITGLSIYSRYAVMSWPMITGIIIGAFQFASFKTLIGAIREKE